MVRLLACLTLLLHSIVAVKRRKYCTSDRWSPYGQYNKNWFFDTEAFCFHLYMCQFGNHLATAQLQRRWTCYYTVETRGFMDSFGTSWIGDLAEYLNQLRENRKQEGSLNIGEGEKDFWRNIRHGQDYTFEGDYYRQTSSKLLMLTFLSIISEKRQCRDTIYTGFKNRSCGHHPSCATPELTNLLRVNPLKLCILTKSVFTYRHVYCCPLICSGKMGDNADIQPVYDPRLRFRWERLIFE